MDTDSDFIQPEFINILFFEQKNLVIFPYVDLKHLRALDIFTIGYNPINLDSTVLNNIKEIIDFDSNNSYSSNRSFYFIHNLNSKKIKDIIQEEGIRCVLNTNENVSDLVNGQLYVFYYKKNRNFINYNFNEKDLEFERYLISESNNDIQILCGELQEVMNIASRIFAEINQNPTLKDNTAIIQILRKYDSRFWPKILKLVGLYYKINVPEIDHKSYLSKRKSSYKKEEIDYSNEYEAIILQNLNIAKEFVQILHDYRSNKVNPSNLELDQLHNPQKLYNYLRNNHWKNGFPKEFLSQWIEMQKTGKSLGANDIEDFEIILNKLKVDNNLIIDLLYGKNETQLNKRAVKDFSQSKIPSVHDFPEFKEYMLKKIGEIEKLILKTRKES